jgi:hypothetical protein
MIGKEQSARPYPQIGVPEAHHPLSHHNDIPELIAQLSKINRYHTELFSQYLAKLRATPDGDGSLLDHSIVVYGSPMGDSNVHEHKRLPLFIAGHGNGTLKGNNHLRCAQGTPMANVLLTLGNKLGLELKAFGDSNGEVAL